MNNISVDILGSVIKFIKQDIFNLVKTNKQDLDEFYFSVIFIV